MTTIKMQLIIGNYCEFCLQLLKEMLYSKIRFNEF